MTTTLDVDARFAAIVDELTRRGLIAGGLGTAAVLGLAACGNDTSAPAAPTTRRMSGAYGEVELPPDPTRIVVFPSAPLSTLLDLGVTPVGTDDDEGPVMVPANRAAAAALPSIGTWGSISPEKIAALKPDLIISTSGWVDKKLYAQISQLAPTLIIDDLTQSWEQVAEETAAALGLGEKLSALKKTYADKLATVRREHGAVLQGNSWEVIQDADQGTFYRWMSNSDPCRILTALGATLGNHQPVGPKTSTIGSEISYEDARKVNVLAFKSRLKVFC